MSIGLRNVDPEEGRSCGHALTWYRSNRRANTPIAQTARPEKHFEDVSPHGRASVMYNRPRHMGELVVSALVGDATKRGGGAARTVKRSATQLF